LRIDPAGIEERAPLLDRVGLVFDPGHDIDIDAERGGAVLASLTVTAPIRHAEIMRTEVAAICKTALELLLLQDIAIVRNSARSARPSFRNSQSADDIPRRTDETKLSSCRCRCPRRC